MEGEGWREGELAERNIGMMLSSFKGLDWTILQNERKNAASPFILSTYGNGVGGFGPDHTVPSIPRPLTGTYSYLLTKLFAYPLLTSILSDGGHVRCLRLTQRHSSG